MLYNAYRTAAAFLCVAGFVCSTLEAQGSLDDYMRSQQLSGRTRNKVFRDEVEPEWFENGSRFWYRVKRSPSSWRYIFVDAVKGVRRDAFDHAALAASLSKQLKKEVSAERLPIQFIRFEGNDFFRFQTDGASYRCTLATYQLEKMDKQTGGTDAETVKRLDSIRPSSGRGRETMVSFVNKRKEKVKLFWITETGQRKYYETVAPGETHRQHTYEGHVWLVTDANDKPLMVFEALHREGTAEIGSEAKPLRHRRRRPDQNRRRPSGGRSPDGKWELFIKEYNLYLRDREAEKEHALTTGGTEDDPYLSRYYWSPDSQRVVVVQEKKAEKREIHEIESSPRNQLQPKLHTFQYTKPGDPIDHPRPRLFHVASQKRIEISDALFPTPWSITEIRWREDSSRFTFLYNQRGHQVLRIVAVDADTGKACALIDERSDTFVDYAHKKFTRYLDETNEIIWMSERDGWSHLYLYDMKTGQVKNQITKGRWVVRRVDRVDPEKRRIWFRAGGVYTRQDPYYIHYCRINFDGTGFVRLTEGDGTHEIEYSPDGSYLIDRYSRVDMAPVTELRRTGDGSLVCRLEQADCTALLATGWKTPERFAAKGRDGKTDIYGIIFRPTTFAPGNRYPVIEQIYAGPQGAFVPKRFSPFHRPQALAELGFIVVQIDGMGTSYRSKSFHDVCWKNLGDAGFPDRILWMRAAAEKRPFMDLSRVGVYGGSAGGQSALRALLAHGDFYKAAAADCGCHDNRMDKIWWNELWMGWPIGPHYNEQSNVTQAHRLQGDLLLMVGELDRNVDPASTMQVVDALIKADKDFDLIVFPGAGHGAGGSRYGRRRMCDFFVEKLLHVTPRWKQ